MSRITSVPLSLCLTIVALWAAASAAAWLVLPQNIALSVRLPFLIAACVELACFAALGWSAVREALGRLPVRILGGWLFASALLPYLLYSVPTGVFRFEAMLALAAMAGLLVFWYAVPGGGRVRDLGFLAVLAAGMLTPVFAWIYPEAAPKLQSEFLGRILWIRLGIAAALLIRRMPGTGFGFWPTAREWRLGALGFVLLFPVLFATGWGIEFFGIRELTRPWYQVAGIAAGTFFGIFWVVALSEEFFLRGLLQQWLVGWTGRLWVGILLTSLISGALHLPFRGFPNWKFALLATIAHAGYGLVFWRGGGILAAMVAHALVVTVWRVFLTG